MALIASSVWHGAVLLTLFWLICTLYTLVWRGWSRHAAHLILADLRFCLAAGLVGLLLAL